MKGTVEAYANGVARTFGVSLGGVTDTKAAVAGMFETWPRAREIMVADREIDSMRRDEVDGDGGAVRESCLLEAGGGESRAPIARDSAPAGGGKAFHQGRGAQLAQQATGFTRIRPTTVSRRSRAKSFLMRHLVFLSAVFAGCLLAIYSHRTSAVMAVPYEVQQLFWRVLA